jgi:hypothetical protein
MTPTPIRSPPSLPVLALALCSLTAVSARAETRLQASADAVLGYTDNGRSSPAQPPPGVAEKASDEFLVLSPGALLAIRSESALHRLGYTYTASLFYHDVSASSSSHRLEYRGFFDLSPRATLVLGSSLSQTKPYAASTVVPASSSELGATLPSTDNFVVVTADELTRLRLARDWNGWQGFSAGMGTPLHAAAGPRTVELSASAGVERVFRADALGTEARATGSSVSNGVRPDGTPSGEMRQLVAGGVGLWRHDFGRDFASRAEAGAVRIQRLTSRRGFWHPIGSAALGYAVQQGQAELSYAHRVATSVLIGQSLLADEVLLRGGLPITPKSEVVIGGSIGYQHGRLIDEDATLAARIDVFLADVALGWQALPNLGASLRYQHIDQRSDASAPPLPLSYVKNTVMLGVALRFPPDSQMPRPYREPRRVDESDASRER